MTAHADCIPEGIHQSNYRANNTVFIGALKFGDIARLRLGGQQYAEAPGKLRDPQSADCRTYGRVFEKFELRRRLDKKESGLDTHFPCTQGGFT